jgi:hypothetical protein
MLLGFLEVGGLPGGQDDPCPLLAQGFAICSPSPREPPVTSADLPVRSNAFFTLPMS